MVAKIESLHWFPLKGGKEWKMHELEVNTKVGVANDRRIAIRKVPGDMTRRPSPFHKTDFFVCANTPVMAIQGTDFILGTIDSYRFDEEKLRQLAEILGVDGQPLEIQVADETYHLGDTKGAQVSFLNMATHRAFERFVGHPVDRRRWRVNVHVSGLRPFQELSWIKTYPGERRMMVGGIPMRLDDVSVRCKATWANPETGKDDIDIQSQLRAFMANHRPRYSSAHHEGKTDIMGFYGVVLNDGALNVGDEIRLL